MTNNNSVVPLKVITSVLSVQTMASPVLIYAGCFHPSRCFRQLLSHLGFVGRLVGPPTNLLVFIIMQNLVEIDTLISIIWHLNILRFWFEKKPSAYSTSKMGVFETWLLNGEQYQHSCTEGCHNDVYIVKIGPLAATRQRDPKNKAKKGILRNCKHVTSCVFTQTTHVAATSYRFACACVCSEFHQNPFGNFGATAIPITFEVWLMALSQLVYTSYEPW